MPTRRARQAQSPPTCMRAAARVDPGIIPNVGAIPPAVAEPKGIGVGGGADLEHEHQLMFISKKCPHAAVGLVPDAEVLELGKDHVACVEQLPHMTPVHAHERNGAVARKRCGMPECLLQ